MSAEIIQPPPLIIPGLGESFTDPAFGSTIKRITAAPAGKWVGVEYPSVSPWSIDDAYLLLVAVDHFNLYSHEGDLIRELLIGASMQPRWSHTEPTKVFCVYENALIKVDVLTGVKELVHQFTEYSKIDGRGESDISSDGTTMALVGDDKEMFVYDLEADLKGPILGTPDRQIESLYLTNDATLVSWVGGGMDLFGHDAKLLRSITSVNSHKTIVRDAFGDDVLIWCCANDASMNCNGIVMTRLRDGAQSIVKTFPWTYAFNFSPGHGNVLVSSYAAPEAPWDAPYRDELFTMSVSALDGIPRRLAHHRSLATNYTAQPHGALRRDGSGAVMSSNMAVPGRMDYCDAYLVTFPNPIPSPPGGSRTYGRPHVKT